MTFASFKESFKTLVPTISIIIENIKEMGFLISKVGFRQKFLVHE